MEEISLKEISKVVVKRKNMIISLSLFVGIVVFSINYFVVPKRYRSEASFVFKSDSMLPDKFGIGSMSEFIANMAFASAEVNYEVVLKSKMMAERVFLNPSIRRRYKSLRQYAKMDDEKLIKSQMEQIGISVKTKVVLLIFEGPTPQLSADVLNLYFEELNKFITQVRREKRQFYEKQMARYERKIVSANRQMEIAVGPENKFKYEQLMRNKILYDKSYAVVYMEYEKALMDEKRSNDAFRVLDPGNVPRLKCYPKTILTTLIFTFATGCFLCYLFILLELRKRGGTAGQ